MTRIIIVDDLDLFRTLLKSTFETDYPDICIVGEAACGKELFDVLKTTAADLLLLDINLPDIWGVDVARRVRKEYPDMKILALSAENTADTVKAMLDAGIDGFISKQTGKSKELAQAIRSVASGNEYFGRDIAAIIFDVYVAKKKTSVVSSDFTEREREIIHLCRDGLIVKEIAEKLNISENTVNNHKKNIFHKIGINNTMEMVQFALKSGIIRVEN